MAKKRSKKERVTLSYVDAQRAVLMERVNAMSFDQLNDVLVSNPYKITNLQNGLRIAESNNMWLTEEISRLKQASNTEVEVHRAVITLLLNRFHYKERPPIEFVDEQGDPVDVKISQTADRTIQNSFTAVQNNLKK